MPAMGQRELLRSIDLFADLTDREAATVLAIMRERRVPRGGVIFHQHDDGGGLYVILEGIVKISRSGRDGREVTMAVLHEGNFLGEMSLLDGQPRSATATAVEAARLLFLDREHFRRSVLAQPRIVAKLLAELSKRIRAADQAIENLALGSVHDRVFHLLGHLGRRGPLREGSAVIERMPTHQGLAEMVGASRETVTRTLAAMERAGLISIEKRRATLLPAFFKEEAGRS
jgi:CRP/FNR family transcriptional regulator/CRP/FNR family cyclic AMP-dependent transcriptional regulator